MKKQKNVKKQQKLLNIETFAKNPSVASKMKSIILTVSISKELLCDWRACAAKYERSTLGAVQKFCKELQQFSDETLDRAINSLLLDI